MKNNKNNSGESKIVKMLHEHDKDIKWLKGNVATKQDLERVYERLTDHEIRLIRIEENMATKHDLRKIYDILDRISEFMARHEQESIMTTRILERLSGKVEEHDVAIRLIKPKLGIA